MRQTIVVKDADAELFARVRDMAAVVDRDGKVVGIFARDLPATADATKSDAAAPNEKPGDAS